MDQYTKAEFAKNSENKEDPSSFTPAVREAGIAQGTIVYSKLYNTMLGELTKFSKSLSDELTNVLAEAGISPSDSSVTQILTAIKQIAKDNTSGVQVGDLVPNISNEAPIGRMVCDGTLVNNCRTLFPDFYQFVLTKTPFVTMSVYASQLNTYGQCGFCGVEGDNVRLPTITRPISGTSDLSLTGQAILDSMRPITGNFGNKVDNGVFDGAFTVGPLRGYVGRFYRNDTAHTIAFDSARLGARYNGSETRGKQVQYPYSVVVYTTTMSQSLANVQELINLLRYQAQLGVQELPATSGTINLISGAIYKGVIDGATSFVLPTPTDNTLLNQILIQLEITSGGSITSWGTQKYLGDQPVAQEGQCNIIYEYDLISSEWFVGQVIKR